MTASADGAPNDVSAQLREALIAELLQEHPQLDPQRIGREVDAALPAYAAATAELEEAGAQHEAATEAFLVSKIGHATLDALKRRASAIQEAYAIAIADAVAHAGPEGPDPEAVAAAQEAYRRAAEADTRETEQVIRPYAAEMAQATMAEAERFQDALARAGQVARDLRDALGVGPQATIQRFIAEQAPQGVVLVDFWAEWCGPCRQLAPEIAKVERAFAGRARVIKVNVDEQQDVAEAFGIRSIPTLVLIKDRTVIGELHNTRRATDLGDVLQAAINGRIPAQGIGAPLDLHGPLGRGGL